MRLSSLSFVFVVIIVLTAGAMFFLVPDKLDKNINKKDNNVLGPGMSLSNISPSVIIGDITLKVEVADTPTKLIKGLSERQSLSNNTGMLFVFGGTAIRSFWMKDMLFPLDIIWISESNKIAGIEKNISPETFPKTFLSPEPVRYVLEVNAGWADANGVEVDDNVIINLEGR